MLNDSELAKINKDICGTDITQVSEVFGALSEPNRCLIFRTLINTDEICVGQIAKLINLSEPLASQHLKILYDRHLLSKRKSGKRVYYKLNRSNHLVETLIEATSK